MAAVLGAGDGAALAGLAAAALWHAWHRKVPEILVVVEGRPRARRGFRIQGARRLDPRDVTTLDGIRVTTVARTLVDLTDELSAAQLANVIHEAAFHDRFSAAATRAAMQRANGRPNLAVLEEALAMNAAGSAGTRSALEDRFLALVERAGLPAPAVNTIVAGHEVDFAWPELVIEVDGPGHRRPRTQADDRRRDLQVRAAGRKVARVTEDDLAGALALIARR